MNKKIESNQIVSLPPHVWKDVIDYVERRHQIKVKHTPVSRWIYKDLDMEKFVLRISKKKAMFVFDKLCKKLGVFFIQDSTSCQLVSTTEVADELIDYIRSSPRVEEVIDNIETLNE